MLLPELNGFTFDDLPKDRQNKLEDVAVRTIVLDTSTEASTRAEMFARINKSGTTANEAEIRRGSLPGPVTELIRELAESPALAAATPMSQKVVDQREREELVTRFFAYLEGWNTPEGRFPGYRDRPKKYLYDYLRSANEAAKADATRLDRMRDEFFSMLSFVEQHFPDGFRKHANHNSVPRVRFEAIAIGTALALRERKDLDLTKAQIGARMKSESFDQVVVSGSANVRSKLEGRIETVRSLLLAAE